MESTIEKEYVTTKDECAAKIAASGNVCSGCGGKREPIETVDNSGRPTFWEYCPTCCIFDNGVPELIFKIAEDMVKNQYHIQHSSMTRPDGQNDGYKAYWLASQIQGTSRLVSRILRTHDKIANEIKAIPHA